MVRLSKDDLLAAWKALDRSQIDELPGAQGWRGIRLFTHQGCSFHAGRRQPDNEEMLIAVFPHPLSPGSAALPSCKGFRVEMAGTEEGAERFDDPSPANRECGCLYDDDSGYSPFAPERFETAPV